MAQSVAIRADGVIKGVVNKPFTAYDAMEVLKNIGEYNVVEAINEQGDVYTFRPSSYSEFTDWWHHGR